MTVLANIVHLVLGVAGLAAAGMGAAARWYLLLGGVVSLLLWMASIAIDPLDAHLNVVALGAPHGWLHFALGAVMVALGGLLSAVRAPVARRA